MKTLLILLVGIIVGTLFLIPQSDLAPRCSLHIANQEPADENKFLF